MELWWVRAALIAAFGAIGGCTPTVLTLLLPLEEWSRAAVVVLQPRNPQGPMQAVAIDPAASPAFEKTLSDADDLEVFALIHDQSLLELGLSPGDVALDIAADASDPPDPAFSSARSGWRDRIRGGDRGGWSRMDPIDPAIAGLRRAVERLALPPGCDRFETEWVVSVPAGEPAFATILPDGRGLVIYYAWDGGVQGAWLFEVDSTMTSAAVVDPDTPHRATMQTPAGELILGGAGHRLWRGRWNGSAIEAAPIGPPRAGGDLVAIDGVVTSTAFEIYTIDLLGVVERWDSSGTPHELTRIASGELFLGGGVARVGEGAALIGAPFEDRPLLVRGSSVTYEATPLPGDGLNQLVRVDGFGIVAGTGRGGMMWRDGAGWHGGSNAVYALAVVGLGAYRDGFLWGGLNGWIGQYGPSVGFCPRQTVGPSSARNLIPWGDDALLVVFDRPGTRNPTVARVRITR